jgi:hypothetical protein
MMDYIIESDFQLHFIAIARVDAFGEKRDVVLCIRHPRSNFRLCHRLPHADAPNDRRRRCEFIFQKASACTLKPRIRVCRSRRMNL